MNQQYDNENRGVLFRNTDKKSDKHPDYSGSLNVEGVEFYLDGWIKQGKKGNFLSLSLKAKQQRKEAPRKPARSEDSDIPF